MSRLPSRSLRLTEAGYLRSASWTVRVLLLSRYCRADEGALFMSCTGRVRKCVRLWPTFSGTDSVPHWKAESSLQERQWMPSLGANAANSLEKFVKVEAGQLDRSMLNSAAAPRIVIRPARLEAGGGAGMASESASPLTRFGVIVECAVFVSCCGNQDVHTCDWSKAKRTSLRRSAKVRRNARSPTLNGFVTS